MYKSPIEIVQSNTPTEILNRCIEENIYRAVWDVGINVDVEELKHALAYDRDQYEQGFRDGSVKQVPKKPVLNNGGGYCCSVCSTDFYDEYRYCPACGQAIDWED